MLLPLVASLCLGRSPGDLKALHGVKRLLILGDSITYSGGYVDALDAYLYAHMPDARIEVINIGLPSENVTGLTEPNHAGGAFPRPDLHERLARALDMVKPNMVLACYGMNDGMYYPYSEDRFRKFTDGMEWLRRSVEKAGARLWLMTPPPFDPLPVQGQLLPAGMPEYPSGRTYKGYDDVLALFSSWELSQRRHGWKVIDIHTPINAFLSEQRKTKPAFALSGDGVHIDETGHRLIARELLRAWGAPGEYLPGIDQSGQSRFLGLVHDRQRILTDAWLSAVGHKRPGMPKGLPVAEAEEKARELDGQIRAAIGRE